MNTIFLLVLLYLKNKLDNFPNIFSEKFDLISDFDFMIRFVKKIIWHVFKNLYIYYRKHNNNMSLTNF